MSKTYFFVLVISISLGLNFLTLQSKASHAAGAEIIYDHVADSTYTFYYKFYRDCNGISAPSSVPLCGRNMCNVQTVSANMTLLAILPGNVTNGSPVSPGCPGYPTNCTSGALPGYQEYWYSATVTIPSKCNFWTFYAGISARNTGILNINNGGNLYTEVKFNTQLTWNNSSPRFLNKPVPYVCINSPFSLNHGGYDPDNDQMVFTNVTPMTGPISCAPNGPGNLGYINGYSLNNPIATSATGPFTFNVVTGQTSFTPTLTGFWALAIRVDEYRGGTWLGSIMRDIQIVVVSNCNNINAGSAINPSIIGGTLASGYIRGCPSQQLNFCFDIYSPDTLVTFRAKSTASTILPGSNLTFTGIGTDSVKGCFSWTPSVSDTGVFTFTVTAEDSSCRPPGILSSNTFTYSILVPPPVQAKGDTIICPNDSIRLTVRPMLADSMVWSVISGDYGSLSCTSCDSPWVTPNVTTIYVVEDVHSPCVENNDTVTVQVLQPPLVDIGYDDTVICQISTVQFNPTVIPAGNYNYSWTPNVAISATNIANPIVSPTVSTKYYLSVTDQISSNCASVDSVFVEVIPLDMHITTNDTAICDGASIQIKLDGTSPDSFTYKWTLGTFLNDSTLMEPICTPDTTVNYILSISRPGCVTTNDQISIEVQPNPTVNLGLDKFICQWDTIHFHPTIEPSWFTGYNYLWTPATNLSSNNVLNPIVTGNTPGNFVYILTATTSPAGCVGTDDVNVTINAGNFLELTPTDTTICSKTSFNANANGAVIYDWSPGYGLDDSTSATPMVTVLAPIHYTLLATDQFGCLDTGYMKVDIAPSAILELGENVTVFDDETYQLNAEGNCSYFKFTPSTFLDNSQISNPTISGLSQNMRYVAQGVTELGCYTSDTVDVTYDQGQVVEVPNAFAPGSGGDISILKIIKKGYFALEYFRIFNRWGDLIFETKDINAGWDGTFKGETQPIGTYVYEIRGKNRNQSITQKSGNFILIK